VKEKGERKKKKEAVVTVFLISKSISNRDLPGQGGGASRCCTANYEGGERKKKRDGKEGKGERMWEPSKEIPTTEGARSEWEREVKTNNTGGGKRRGAR